MNADEMAAFVTGIINRCGGIDKWQQLRLSLQDMKASKKLGDPAVFQRYLRRVAKRQDGADQLVAIALLGLTLGEVVHYGKIARERSETKCSTK
jgi:hypothetical protein